MKRLGAPLVNVRASWGAVRKKDGAVFLRVWQDQCQVDNGSLRIQITHHAFYAGVNDNFGHNERKAHVEAIRNGAPSFMLMCLAKDPKADPRQIQSVNVRELFVGGELQEIDGESWLRVAEKVSFDSVRA